MIVILRFDGGTDMAGRLDAAVRVLARCPGFVGADVVQNLDEPDLWALVLRWENVGAYRRALGGYEAKVQVVPLLSLAIDEPTAYDDPAHVGVNVPRELPNR